MRIEIIHSSRARVVLLAIGCSLFVISSVFALTQGLLGILGGLLGIVFFGFFGFRAVRRMSKNLDVLVLSPSGIRIAPGAVLPWEDFEVAGVVWVGTVRMLGIRMSSYLSFVLSMSPEHQAELKQFAAFGKVAGVLTLPITMLDPAAWLKAGLTGDISEPLNLDLITLPHREIASMLEWNRDQSGYDVLWPDSLLSGSLKSMRQP